MKLFGHNSPTPISEAELEFVVRLARGIVAKHALGEVVDSKDTKVSNTIVLSDEDKSILTKMSDDEIKSRYFDAEFDLAKEVFKDDPDLTAGDQKIERNVSTFVDELSLIGFIDTLQKFDQLCPK